MKRTMLVVAFGMAMLAAVAVSARAGDPLPGQVDFGTFSPPGSKGEFVEINVPANLIALVARFVEKQEPYVAQLLNRLQLVHVSVIGLNDENRADLEKRAQKVRKDLEGKGWERIVKVVKQEQDVGIYLKTQGKDTVQGLAVVVLDGKQQAVFVNIVGDIKPEQLALLGDRLHIEPLKKIGQMTEKTEP
jgi:Na+-translocating ferredoxin:NAD+ oxidoreductase RnfG subunit